MREEAEQKRLKTVLELQFILDKLGDDEVRNDLKQGTSGVPVLTEEELTMLDEFYKLVYPERDMNMRSACSRMPFFIIISQGYICTEVIGRLGEKLTLIIFFKVERAV